MRVSDHAWSPLLSHGLRNGWIWFWTTNVIPKIITRLPIKWSPEFLGIFGQIVLRNALVFVPLASIALSKCHLGTRYNFILQLITSFWSMPFTHQGTIQIYVFVLEGDVWFVQQLSWFCWHSCANKFWCWTLLTLLRCSKHRCWGSWC